MPKAVITYLFHSGYAVETAEHFFIFDYYQPNARATGGIDKGLISGDYLRTKKNVVVLSSHQHRDHFDPIILQWRTANPSITYILSQDIKIADNSQCRHMSPDQTITVGQTNITSFGSTDAGVSFLVQADGVCLFHAGDLNWWHWKGESHQYLDDMKKTFLAEIRKIAKHTIDIAFFPVDRRLAEYYCLGAMYFAKIVKPKLLLPMHFGKDYGATAAFAEQAKRSAIATAEITQRGQIFLV